MKFLWQWENPALHSPSQEKNKHYQVDMDNQELIHDCNDFSQWLKLAIINS